MHNCNPDPFVYRQGSPQVTVDHLTPTLTLTSALTPFLALTPQLNLTIFSDIANAAFGTVFDPPYDPFKDDISFLIATYIMEDVGVSGYLVRCPAFLFQLTSPFSRLL